MHLYHLADVCTVLRFVAAGALIVWACTNGSAEGALVAFLGGELTDALDGSLARRFPYPRDGRRRWWRDSCGGRLPEIYDQVSDILLAVAALLYAGLNINSELALWLGGLSICIAVPVQIWRGYRMRLIPDEDDDPLRVKVILARRVLYLAGIVVITLVMIGALKWSMAGKVILITACTVAGLILLETKNDRLQRDKPQK